MPNGPVPAAAEGLPGADEIQTVAEIFAAAPRDTQRAALEFLRRNKERERLKGTVIDRNDANREVLEAYRQWLHYEGALLGDELYPELQEFSDRYIPDTFARDFHFPTDGDWRGVPKPSTRAAAVLQAVGVMPRTEPLPASTWRGLRLPAFPVGEDDFQPAWALYEALRTLNQVAQGLLSQGRFSSDLNYTAAGHALEALQEAIAIAGERIAEAARSAPRPDGDGYYRALIILSDAASSLEGLDQIADITRDLRDH